MPLENGKSKGYLFIQFKSTELADLAIKITWEKNWIKIIDY